jgi:hypothetical protein
LCKTLILQTTGFEVHEVILSRGEVEGCPDYVKTNIHHHFNQVALHSQCHAAEGHTEEGRKICTQYLVTLYGKTKIVNWLKLIGFAGGCKMALLIEEKVRYVSDI